MTGEHQPIYHAILNITGRHSIDVEVAHEPGGPWLVRSLDDPRGWSRVDQARLTSFVDVRDA